MSLYIVSRQFGAIPRLLRLRAFSTDIGLDPEGALCMGDPHLNLFTIFRHDDHYTLRAAADDISVNSKKILAGESVLLPASAEISVLEYTMQTQAGSSTSESSASSEHCSDDEILGYIEINIAGLRQRFPLFEGEFSIGCVEEDSMLLPIAGVSARHLRAKVSRGTIEILPSGGRLSVNRTEISSRHQVVNTSLIRLEPAGVLVSIEVSSAETARVHLDHR